MIFEKRYDRLQTYEPLHEFYDLKNTIISVKKEDNALFLKINYSKDPDFIHFCIPHEINVIIHSYRKETIEINTKLVCPERFPYMSPTWVLTEVKHNFRQNLFEHYQYITDLTNESNIERMNWSCIYGFEKEILRFFIRINHFDAFV
jgi:hypothetical protein